MKITAVTRFKLAELHLALKRLGWGHVDLSKKTGISARMIGEYINLRKKPSKETAEKIQKALAAEGVFLDVFSLWPDAFKGFSSPVVHEHTAEVDLTELRLRNEQQILLNASAGLHDKIDDLLATLPPKTRYAIEGSVVEGKTYRELGAGDGVCASAIYSRVRNGLRLLRSSVRAKLVKELAMQ